MPEWKPHGTNTVPRLPYPQTTRLRVRLGPDFLQPVKDADQIRGFRTHRFLAADFEHPGRFRRQMLERRDYFFPRNNAVERAPMVVQGTARVVEMHGRDASLEKVQGLGHVAVEMRVPYVEAHPHVTEMRVAEKFEQAARGRQVVRDVFRQDFHTPLPGEQAQVFETRESGVVLAQVMLFPGDSQVDDEEAEGNALGQFEEPA